MSSNVHMYTRGNEAARNMGNGVFFSCQHCHHTTIVTSFSYSNVALLLKLVHRGGGADGWGQLVFSQT